VPLVELVTRVVVGIVVVNVVVPDVKVSVDVPLVVLET
jgi:hypothetical protein